ncbi:MAG: hypothetical protein AB8E82_00710 [Aureispira sp.]
MESSIQLLTEKLQQFCQVLEQEFFQISEKRKEKLQELSAYVLQKLSAQETPQVIVICTHNSRRSHMGQLWLAIGADYFDLPTIKTYSGGTEATAFDFRVVEAFRRIGVQIATTELTAINPVYQISWNEHMQPYEAFSKAYPSAPNPTKDFAAVMVCAEADAGCPIVSGCDVRLALPYVDPKAFDDTDREEEAYNERVHQIGREILFVLHQVKLGLAKTS